MSDRFQLDPEALPSFARQLNQLCQECDHLSTLASHAASSAGGAGPLGAGPAAQIQDAVARLRRISLDFGALGGDVELRSNLLAGLTVPGGSTFAPLFTSLGWPGVRPPGWPDDLLFPPSDVLGPDIPIPGPDVLGPDIPMPGPDVVGPDIPVPGPDLPPFEPPVLGPDLPPFEPPILSPPPPWQWPGGVFGPFGGSGVVNHSATAEPGEASPPADEPAPPADEGGTPPTEPQAPDPKQQAWDEYQARGGTWDYEHWSKVYDLNQTRASQANEAVKERQQELGWGRTEVTVDAGGQTRRIDIADPVDRRGEEVKTGYQTATQDNLSEIERDQRLIEAGWEIDWYFTGTVSKPLLERLQEAGIPTNQ